MKIRFILLLCALSLLAACHSSQELAYFSDAERDSVQAVLSTYNTTIHPGDQLYIYVYSQAPEIAVPFNQETHSIAAEITHLNSVGGTSRSNKMSETFQQSNSSQIPGYLVDEAGTIVFPILGKMVVAGLTQDSLSRRIQNMLIDGGYINDPVVTVTPMNFRVSVVGEVRRPREIHINGNRLTILEAIAMCEDLTIYGQRENIIVMRENNGEVTPIIIDLTKKALFDSDAYYLQSNDIVYVEPNKHKRRKMQRDPNWHKYISTSVSVVVLLRNLYRTWYIRAPRYM